MDETQEHESMFMFGEHVAWWPKNQVALTFHSPLEPTQDNKQPIIDSLHLDDINRFLGERLHLTLKSFEDKDVSRPSEEEEPGESLVDEGLELLGKGLKAVGEAVERLGEEIEELGEKLIDHVERKEGESTGDEGGEHDKDDDEDKDLKNQRGKYLFPSPDPEEPGSTLIAFFNVEPTTDSDETDHTVAVVNLFNTTPFIVGSSGEKIQVPATSPNWYGGASQDLIHGCPAVPPMPVAPNEPCTSSGYSHISYRKLSEELQGRDGSGVRVFVLDTIPSPEIITTASNAANPSGGVVSNRLLQDMTKDMQSANSFNVQPPLTAKPPGINIYYQNLSDNLEGDGEDTPRTGKDILQRLLEGYKVPDHGLFITGIIRDLAPGAQIECVRLLNDFGVNTLSTLVQALEVIQNRMSTGDLQDKPVVINLSFVITPYDEQFKDLKLRTKDDSQKDIDLRKALKAIKSLVKSGAVFVASAGNDSNSPEMKKRRMGPRHPAAFPEVVSVAAVIGDQETAALYSNCATSPKQPNGIATYGGSIATRVPPPQPTGLPVEPIPTSCMTGAKDIDALIGVYTFPTYPRLVDPSPDKGVPGDCNASYSAPKPDDYWAYWSGTSFSAPIISALVARILQEAGPGSRLSSQQVVAIINAVAVTSENSELGDVGVVGMDHCQQGVVIK